MDPLKEQIGGQHYKDCAIQPIEYCHRNKLGVCESFVIKYVTRHRAKGGRQDLEKAVHCLRLLIQLEYAEPEIAQKIEKLIQSSDDQKTD